MNDMKESINEEGIKLSYIGPEDYVVIGEGDETEVERRGQQTKKEIEGKERQVQN